MTTISGWKVSFSFRYKFKCLKRPTANALATTVPRLSVHCHSVSEDPAEKSE